MRTRSSSHASTRSAQRAISKEQIDFAMAWGAEIPQPVGRLAYHVGRREVARARAHGLRVPDRTLGVAVVVAADNTVVTVVRSPDRKRLRQFGRTRQRARGAW